MSNLILNQEITEEEVSNKIDNNEPWFHGQGGEASMTKGTDESGTGYTGAEDAVEIQEDINTIEAMRSDVKRKGLRHTPSMHTAKKRKRKIALQKASRKRNRSK